ncbi:hypothetical protein FB451DRAFT_1209051 [Mycena latifolia]|nr:hypothetical protein FB451DRAFT_1209051 [Mycena latifolia]
MFPRLAFALLSLLALAAATPAPIDAKLQPIIASKNNIGFVNPVREPSYCILRTFYSAVFRSALNVVNLLSATFLSISPVSVLSFTFQRTYPLLCSLRPTRMQHPGGRFRQSPAWRLRRVSSLSYFRALRKPSAPFVQQTASR